MSETRVTALLTCHNRVDRTIRCLESLFAQRLDDIRMDVVLVDAGSTDGTGEQVAARFPDVDVLTRGPELFWNGGMRVAFAHAYSSDPDLYLWLNDDVVLDGDAIATLMTTHTYLRSQERPPSIVVGSTREPGSGRVSYGGVVRPSRQRPMYYEVLPPADMPLQVETMNGNCVLVPRQVASKIGTLAAAYTHAFGDYDYGQRAVRAGCEVWIAPGTVGTCARNPPPHRAESFGEHRRLATGQTSGLPPREWITFARRSSGILWPLYAASPYILRLVRWRRGN